MDTTDARGSVCPDGHINPVDQHFCGECGKPLGAASDETLDGDAFTEQPAKASARRLLRPRVLLPAVVVASLVIGGGVLLLTRSSSPAAHTMTGVLTLTDTDEFWRDGDPCEGSGGYDDIREGAQVTVKDENGHVLATSDLLQGVASSEFDCDFAFIVDGVPDAKFYAVEVSHRGEITSSRQEMEDNAWLVGLSLGD